MNSRLFAESYPTIEIPTLPDTGGTNQERSDRWSIVFGESLRQHLLGVPSDIPDIDDYYAWMRNGYPNMEARLFEENDKPEKVETAARKIGGLTFHVVNMALMPLYNVRDIPSDSKANNQTRFMNIILCQANVAVKALVWCKYRSELEKKGIYYSEEFDEYRNVIQGRLAELDAASALLYFIRREKRGYNLFASPAQFERGPESSRNSDLIVASPESEEAIGIQVKSMVTNENADEYDPNMIVLLDGGIDLGGHKIVRVNDGHGHLKEKKVSYGGMLAIEYLTNIPTGNGRTMSDMQVLQDYSGLPRTVYLAHGIDAKAFRSASGITKPFMPQASKIVEHRIGHRLRT